MEPPKAVRIIARAIEPEPEVPPAPPKLMCDDGTAAAPAAAPEPAWHCTRPDGVRHGRFIALFPDGAIEIEGTYRDGTLEGPWQRKHATGAVAERGLYAAGKKTGTWTLASSAGAPLGEYELVAGTGLEKRWYDDGKPYSVSAVKSGARHGTTKQFDREGSVVQQTRYVNGKPDGAHTVGWKRTLRIEEKFASGVRIGVRKMWQWNALLAEENFDRRGRPHGDYEQWRTAKVARVKGRFSKGLRSGAWTWFDRENRKERAGTYAAGERDGLWQEWADSRLVFSGTYRRGKPHGEFTHYDRAGRLLGSFTMRNGTGTMVTFHAAKKPATRQQWRRGLEDGPYQELTYRGKVIVDGNYRAGVKHGPWKEFSSSGAPELEQHWKLGALHGTVTKFVDGKPSVVSTYADGKADGPYAEFRDGKPAVTGQFAADLKTGTWTHHDASGSVVLEATYKDGILEGPWRQRVGGEVLAGSMVAGRRTGAWTRTDKAGVVRKLTYGPP